MKCLFDVSCPVIVLLQETMITTRKTCEFVLKLRPTRKCFGIDAYGFFGGLMVGWNPIFSYFNIFASVASLMGKKRLKGLDRNIRVLNIYVPYHRHLEF